MACRAVISSSYLIRLALLGGMFTFWFSWCMYDGYVNYPRQREISRAYASFKDEGRIDQWADYAQERGWPDGTTGDPGKDHSDMDIYTQYIMGYGVLPFALLFGVSFFRSIGRWMTSSENGLEASWGQKVAFDQVTGLDKTRWRSKGIAVVQYMDQSKKRRLILDNFKFSPDEIGEMVSDVESRLSPEQITPLTPPPESPPDVQPES